MVARGADDRIADDRRVLADRHASCSDGPADGRTSSPTCDAVAELVRGPTRTPRPIANVVADRRRGRRCFARRVDLRRTSDPHASVPLGPRGVESRPDRRARRGSPGGTSPACRCRASTSSDTKPYSASPSASSSGNRPTDGRARARTRTARRPGRSSATSGSRT